MLSPKQNEANELAEAVVLAEAAQARQEAEIEAKVKARLNQISVRTFLEMAFLSYTNDFLTEVKFAEYHGITEAQAKTFLLLAKEVFNSQHPDA